MSAPITPDERSVMRERAQRLHHYGGESQEASEDILAALDALDTAEAEVDLLRAATSPVWDEDTVTEAARRAVAGAVVNVSNWPDGAQAGMLGRDLSAPIDAITSAVLDAVREHAPVRPDRETVAQAIFEAGAAGAAVEFGLDGPVPWSSLDADDVERMCAQADAALTAWPGESRATVQAEALRAFADTRGVNVGDDDDEWWRGYRQAQRECLHDASARADRIEKGDTP